MSNQSMNNLGGSNGILNQYGTKHGDTMTLKDNQVNQPIVPDGFTEWVSFLADKDPQLNHKIEDLLYNNKLQKAINIFEKTEPKITKIKTATPGIVHSILIH